MIELYNIIILNEQYKDCINKKNPNIHEAKTSNLLFGNPRMFEYIKTSSAVLIPEEFLDLLKSRLVELFNLENIRNILDLIDNYIDKHKYYIRKHFREKWLAFNPKLKGRIFNYIESYDGLEIWYYFGLLCADGYVMMEGKNHYTIALSLQSEDKRIVYQFADFLGLPDSKVKPHDVYGDDGKVYHNHRLNFNCRSMVEDLKSIGIFGSKSERKKVPKVVKDLIKKAKDEKKSLILPNIWVSPSGKKALTWLRGYYDGDGLKGTTGIICENKEYLDEIKKLFNTLYDPTLPNNSAVYHLSLGSVRFNNMLKAYNGGLNRVSRNMFNEDKERLLIVKKTLLKLKIPKDKLKFLFSFYTQTELTKLFRCSTASIKNISSTFGIFDVFPRSIHRQKEKPEKVKVLYYSIKHHIDRALTEYGVNL